MSNRPLAWVLLILLSLVWGSSFILMKLGMRDFSSHQVAALRLVFAFGFVLPFWIWHFRKEHLALWKYFLATALFGNFIPAFLFTLAETGIGSALAGMLNAFTPLATAILGAMVWGKKTGGYARVGLFTGLAGTLLLFFTSEGEDTSSPFIYSAMVLAATVCYGISINVIRNNLKDVNPVTNTVWTMSICGIPALAYLYFDTPLPATHTVTINSSLGYIAILGVIGSSVSVILFNILIQKSNALFASSVTYLIPVVAVFWGLVYDENLNTWQVLSMGAILAGVWLLNRE